nr:hypothetical protein [Tanacetum cinerariifolium]
MGWNSGNQYQGQFSQMQPQGIEVIYSGNYGMFPVQSSSREEQGVRECCNISLSICLRTPCKNMRPCLHLDASFESSLEITCAPSEYMLVEFASLPPMDDGIVPEAKISRFLNTMKLPQEWEQNHLSFLPFHHGNLIEEAVGSHSNSSSIFSEGTKQLISRDDSKKASKFPSMSRQDRILRYFEKTKARKYEKKRKYSLKHTHRHSLVLGAGLQGVRKQMLSDMLQHSLTPCSSLEEDWTGNIP